MGDNYQKQLEETRNRYIGIGAILAIIVLLAGLAYRRKGKSSLEEPFKQIDLGNLAEVPLVETEPTVNQQWTDDSGYTWRVMSNGETQWWDGTNWQAYPLQDKES